MVKGLETFRKAMVPYKEHFVIIGGTACDIRLTGTTMIPRATDDIDIIVYKSITDNDSYLVREIIHKAKIKCDYDVFFRTLKFS